MEDALKALAQTFAKLPSRDEFVAAFRELAELIAKSLGEMNRKIDARLASVRDGRDGKDGKDGKPGAKGDRGERGPKGDTGAALFGPRGKDGKDGKDGSPDTPEQVRDKLETLEGEERLTIAAIKDLREELDELKKRGSGQHHTFAIQRGQLSVYDLSDQLDGVTKTFTLPAFWRIISVQSTSTPVVFRPTVDYTSDAAAPSITFTSAVDAATTLAGGQSLIVIYAAP